VSLWGLLGLGLGWRACWRVGLVGVVWFVELVDGLYLAEKVWHSDMYRSGEYCW
jgi:hypothetical protein